MAERTQLLTVSGVRKSYSTLVLDDVGFELCRGEVHALVGENGAGKTTLARIIAGFTLADSGTMSLGGAAYAPQGKREAEGRGVRMVLQELNLVPTLTVAENLFLGRMPHRWGWVDYGQMNGRCREALGKVGLGRIDPGTLVSALGVGQQQLVEIAAGLVEAADLLILDEPTAALTEPEIEELFNRIDELRAGGTGIIYISHRMEEIRRVADRVSVLRDGRKVATRPVAGFSLDEIIRLMVGRDLEDEVRREPHPAGEVALRVKGLRRGAVVRDVSFEVRRGEILGFAGLMGSGRTETMRAVFGADRPEGGEVRLGTDETSVAIRSPREAVRRGMALITEDRKEQGLLLPLAIRANITLRRLGRLCSAPGWICPRRERKEATDWAAKLGVRCASIEQPAAELSGGNQQKVVLAKWLSRDGQVLIFDEPTRGIDVGAKLEIYRLLTELARKGKAIVMVSSDLKELLYLCDRIAVMSAGRLAATFRRGEWTRDKIMAAALSGYLNPDAPR